MSNTTTPKEDKTIKWYIYSGIMISFGIAFVQSSIIRIIELNESPLYASGIIFGGTFIGIGLLPFKMRRGLKQ